MSEPLMRINALKAYFYGQEKIVKALDGVSLDIRHAEILALVGGSGSGKTMTGLSMLRLLPPGAAIVQGDIFFEGKNLMTFSESQMCQVRGRDISMVFQDSLSSFNPLLTIGEQLSEVLAFHKDPQRRPARTVILEQLEKVGLGGQQRILHSYPHQLSGGMRQRAMIAQALLAQPKLLIADEPTSNLDVTLQVQILELFRFLKQELGLTVLLITHDLGLVAQLADRIAIINKGAIVECGSVENILNNPNHSYTKDLLEAATL